MLLEIRDPVQRSRPPPSCLGAKGEVVVVLCTGACAKAK